MKCTLCSEDKAVPYGESAQSVGWSQVSVSTPERNAYLIVCPGHTLADVIAWLRGILKK